MEFDELTTMELMMYFLNAMCISGNMYNRGTVQSGNMYNRGIFMYNQEICVIGEYVSSRNIYNVVIGIIEGCI